MFILVHNYHYTNNVGIVGNVILVSFNVRLKYRK